jgi:NAD dependent epimerase/dehydratase family enzyme
MEDVIGSVYHVLTREDIAGPVNIVSPDPVTNMQFTSSLGRVLSRPTPLPLPESVIKSVFGQMGREILLSSTRVMPEVLIKSGYRFRNPELLMSLRHMLGKS